MVVPALPRRYVLPLACAGLSASVTLLLWLFTSPGIDAPSHLFQTWLFSHGGFDIYNNYWYAGRYEFVNYSMLYYAVAAQVGQLGVLFPASALLGGCFALVCGREWASAARGPSITFAVTAPFIMMVGGTYPFLAGVASSLLALALLQRRRRIWFGLAVLVTLAFSPLSFSLLCAVLAGVLLGKAQPLGALRSNRAAFGIVLAVFIVGVLLQRAFPSQGWYPYDLWDALIVLVFSLVGLWIAGTAAPTRSMRAMFVAYLALNLFAFLLKGPIGSNPSRLFAIAGAPMLWLTANLNPRRSRLLVFPLIAAAVALQVAPKMRDAYSAYENPAAASSYWRPARQFVEEHRAQIRRLPGRRGLDLGPLGGLLRGQVARAAGARMVPAGGLPAERLALQRRDDAGHVPGLDALAGRPLRDAARRAARLQLRARGAASEDRRVRPAGRRQLAALDLLRAAAPDADRDAAARPAGDAHLPRPAARGAVAVGPR